MGAGDESPRHSNWTYSDGDWEVMDAMMSRFFDEVCDLRKNAWEKYDIWWQNKKRKQLKKNYILAREKFLKRKTEVEHFYDDLRQRAPPDTCNGALFDYPAFTIPPAVK